MSLSELVSFAVSGTAASAVSALITDRVSPEERRGRPRQRGRDDVLAADSKLITKSTAPQSAANGLIYFFTYYVAATAQYTSSTGVLSPSAPVADKNIHHAAKDAFLAGATASVFTRLLGFVAGPERPPGYRWSLPALEDNALLAIDPGLTFFVHEILVRRVTNYLERWRQRSHIIVSNDIMAAVTTFVVAATSKVVATGLTYPFHAAAAEATEQRWLAKEAEDEGGAPPIPLDDEDGHHYPGRHAERPRRRHSNKRPSKRRHSVFVVLMQMLRSGGVQSVYVDWLRHVLTTAFGHGLTMALQRSIYGYILQFVLSLVGQRRASPSIATATATATAAAAAPATKGLDSHTHSHTQPRPTEEVDAKVKNAVDSWLETSSVASRGTVEVDDSISNVTSRVSSRSSRSPPPPPHRQQAHQRQPPRQPSTYEREPPAYQRQPPAYQRQPPAYEREPSSSEREPSVYERQPSVYQREPSIFQRQRREVASVASSRASEPTAFYPDAIAAGRQQRQPSPPRGLPLPSHDFDDDGSSLVFNMVSKSPRVIDAGRERS